MMIASFETIMPLSLLITREIPMIPFNKNRVVKLGTQTNIKNKIIHWYELDNEKYGLMMGVGELSLRFINEKFEGLQSNDEYRAVFNGLVNLYSDERD